MAAPAPTAASPTSAVDRARHRFAGARHDRAVTDQQQSFLDQSSGHGQPGAGEDAGERRSRNSHPLGCGFLIQTLEIGQAKGLELVDPQCFHAELAHPPTDRLETPPFADATDFPELFRSSHKTPITNICSKPLLVNPVVGNLKNHGTSEYVKSAGYV